MATMAAPAQQLAPISSSSSPSRRYVTELDTLRAGAVLAVLATHADLPFSGGGVLGVDVFFVLSGFLITELLLRESAATGRISWKNFYLRRGLRLLPALLAAAAGTLLMVLLTARSLDASHFAEIGATPPADGLVSNTFQEIAAALFYVADFGGSLGIEDVFFGHTWSLSVEEQFYAFLPPIIAFMAIRPSSRRLFQLLVAFTMLLAVIRILGFAGPVSIFQLRFDQLLVGVSARLLLDQATRYRIGRLWPAALTVLVVLMMVGIQTSQTLAGRATYSIAGLCAAILVYACWTDELGLGRRLFSIPAVTYLGRISYGVYLYHLPIFRRVAMEDFAMPSAAVVGLKFGLTAIVAMLSFALIERPALRLKERIGKRSLHRHELPSSRLEVVRSIP